MTENVQPDYEYRGMIASCWDLLRGDSGNSGDRQRYLDLIEQFGQPALIVGCGTGRLVLDYLNVGIDVDGIDISPEMLAHCREKAERRNLHPTLYQQPMESMDLPRRYRTIIVPSSSFQLVTDPEAATEAMRRFLRHLEPGGILAMSFMVLWLEGEDLESDWWMVTEQVRPENGDTVRRWSRYRYEPDAQLEHTQDRYEVIRNGEVIAEEHHLRSPATRAYRHDQVSELFDRTGFINVHLTREWSTSPAAPDDELIVATGIKPIRD